MLYCKWEQKTSVGLKRLSDLRKNKDPPPVLDTFSQNLLFVEV